VVTTITEPCVPKLVGPKGQTGVLQSFRIRLRKKDSSTEIPLTYYSVGITDLERVASKLIKTTVSYAAIVRRGISGKKNLP
jgi:hypothetical protein